jgi:hypothetical protein
LLPEIFRHLFSFGSLTPARALLCPPQKEVAKDYLDVVGLIYVIGQLQLSSYALKSLTAIWEMNLSISINFLSCL